MTYNWDEWDQSGDFVSFKDVGDSVVGTLKSIRTGRDFNGNACPELLIENELGEDKTVTAGQVLLKAALAEKRPQAGDKIRITYSGIGEARPGKAPAKVFTVEVKAGQKAAAVPDPF